MTSRSEIENLKSILVFLPTGAAQAIVARLVEHGYPATAVHSVPELFDALRSGNHSLAVTTSRDIDMVRNIRSIPVVNLGGFFRTVGSADESATSTKAFDGKAFLNRINTLHEPMPGNGTGIRGELAANSRLMLAGKQLSRWWTAARSSLGKRASGG
ncbi:hypothetical protein G6K93_32345 [Agrobacterium rhizogenes]|uniref:hypothetical protein n=1 Tax=Rhizobium rhizogenes TaxID=359 RepID=UPI001572FD85|nr:hypothetical protein [Rhizobium rhizogenes]NTF52800.1 hypothetical protein [Rhizobium rhizogenes]NTF59502.1 hypothetical protein [Rhizobium rhizogenes]NTF79062.1 hypothetical protein [Rhizobium rhizogenes]NTG04719.1 hypothetical protein [Rhizobium rhizogenes]NTG18293.1 hypothetical protein [Rhizobium rhizogenes]